MKCSEARELFCARIDEELSGERLSRMDTHLTDCRDCRAEWIRHRSTVTLVQGLPEETTQPAFVGQVLDRIRAYEAEGRKVPDPMDSVPSSVLAKWLDRARSWTAQWVLRPVPAMAVGSLVVGVAVGSWVNHASSDGSEATAVAAAPVLPTDTADPRLEPILTPRPFGDLTEEVRAREVELRSPRTQFYSPNWGGSGLQQQVRFENDGPRIIF